MKLRALTCSALLLAIAPMTGHADSGWYIGGSAGGATLEVNIGDTGIPGVPSNIDEDDTAFKGFVGYKFDLPTVDLGIEGGYVDFGEPELRTNFGDITFDVSGINLWGIAAVEAGPVDLFAKLGYIDWDVEISAEGVSEGADGTDLGYGLGLSFGVGPIDIRGEWEVYELDDADMSMLSLGIVYQFN